MLKETPCISNGIILPIKPEFVDAILLGEKMFEYRKKLCKKKINKIYLYKTAPVKAIVGEVEVIGFLRLDKEDLWEKTKKGSGISKDFYDSYFENVAQACAYILGNPLEYSKKITLEEVGINYTIQSYKYVENFNIM